MLCRFVFSKEHFISMLSQLLTGKSYELILTFASVKGELKTFVHKLIKYNELSRQVSQNDGISPYVKALLFDLTFVILCSIVQKYGSDVSICELHSQNAPLPPV